MATLTTGICGVLALMWVLEHPMRFALGGFPRRSSSSPSGNQSAVAGHGWEMITSSTVKTVVGDKHLEKDYVSVTPGVVPPISVPGALLSRAKNVLQLSSTKQDDQTVNQGVAHFLNPFRDKEGRPLPLPDIYYEHPTISEIETVLKDYERVALPAEPIMESNVPSVEEALADAMERS